MVGMEAGYRMIACELASAGYRRACCSLASFCGQCYLDHAAFLRKEDHAMQYYFQFRQRGPVNALQMRLQG
ncbi:hypothetical protein G9X64_00570 [Rhizobium sophorae]|uniref:Uncharacterized protein n=1 Tax=Rhizobium sophorae TaxID=1535242 RepID=A0A7Y3S106_9HYPH|nr:hypothetical protein [Rhizobium sophorae]MBX4862359.1 hypothetical protein [Rhizobium bangladeshense]NNU35034.1 hypothetical protein [Rhizobium sophorae]